MLEKLNIVKQRFDEISDLIIQPDIISDQKRYVELTKEYKDLKKLMDERENYIRVTNRIEEAEEIADRVGVINNGELILIEEKASLMSKLGKKQLLLDLREALSELPASLIGEDLELSGDGHQLIYTFNAQSEHTGITSLLNSVKEAGIGIRDLNTTQSSLEDIFVSLVHESS